MKFSLTVARLIKRIAVAEKALLFQQLRGEGTWRNSRKYMGLFFAQNH